MLMQHSVIQGKHEAQHQIDDDAIVAPRGRRTAKALFKGPKSKKRRMPRLGQKTPLRHVAAGNHPDNSWKSIVSSRFNGVASGLLLQSVYVGWVPAALDRRSTANFTSSPLGQCAHCPRTISADTVPQDSVPESWSGATFRTSSADKVPRDAVRETTRIRLGWLLGRQLPSQ